MVPPATFLTPLMSESMQISQACILLAPLRQIMYTTLSAPTSETRAANSLRGMLTAPGICPDSYSSVSRTSIILRDELCMLTKAAIEISSTAILKLSLMFNLTTQSRSEIELILRNELSETLTNSVFSIAHI